jgi:hypothetical protein
VKGGIHESLIKLMEDYEEDDVLISHCLDPLHNLLVQGMTLVKKGLVFYVFN